MEGNASPIDGIVTAVTNMATTVQGGAIDMIVAVLPIAAVVIAATIVAKKGKGIVQSFMGGR